MVKEEILLQLNNLFKDVLDNPDVIVTESSTASDIEEWDSLNHIQLVVAIEKHFKLKFTSSEILSWKNVGEMIDAILHKLG